MSENRYEKMEKGKKEARIGLDSEKDIINMINISKEFQDSLRRCLITLGFNPEKKIIARKNNTKTDILIKISDKEEIGVSIKSSTRTSFHQIDRRRLEEWKAFLGIPNDIFEIMKEAILRVARNSRDKFILEEDRDKIREFFANNFKKIIYEIFRKKEQNLKLLMINDKRKRRIYIFNMDDALVFLFENARNKIDFTKKGIIRLGDFITIQRKGGNGKRVTIPKTDWMHPGNQLQFKFSPLRFAEYIEKTKAIRFCTINY
ncbi:MAG: hypothetical protein ACTSSP_09980 [Candidatus Asgardarchaeia archaeon]